MSYVCFLQVECVAPYDELDWADIGRVKEGARFRFVFLFCPFPLEYLFCEVERTWVISTRESGLIWVFGLFVSTQKHKKNGQLEVVPLILVK